MAIPPRTLHRPTLRSSCTDVLNMGCPPPSQFQCSDIVDSASASVARTWTAGYRWAAIPEIRRISASVSTLWEIGGLRNGGILTWWSHRASLEDLRRLVPSPPTRPPNSGGTRKKPWARRGPRSGARRYQGAPGPKYQSRSTDAEGRISDFDQDAAFPDGCSSVPTDSQYGTARASKRVIHRRSSDAPHHQP